MPHRFRVSLVVDVVSVRSQFWPQVKLRERSLRYATCEVYWLAFFLKQGE